MAEKKKVLIADNLAEEGVAILEDSGFIDIDYRKKTPREDLLNIISEYDGLIIRSATKVDSEVLEKASKLKVVIRAGVGVDNIDIPACSQKGIVVMNAPGGNSISTAEQAIALMFAMARKTPQADKSMKEKKWEKSKFMGTQLTGKTLGVIGLGRIGKEVVKRGKGLQMKILGFDPYIPKENLEHLQIKIVSKETIIEQADFITVHTPLTDATRGIVNKGNLSKLKKGVRLINAARGGIYDEDALYQGVKDGIIASVGIDVYSTEPPENFPLLELDQCVFTPHLGASTGEAQIEVAKETASEMVAYLGQGVARNSLNFPTLDPDEMDVLAPWFDLCEKIGNLAGQLLKGAPKTALLEISGNISQLTLKPLKIALAKGILCKACGSEINLVNAPILADERGLSIALKIEDKKSESNVIKLKLSGDDDKVEIRATVNFSGGTVIGLNGLPLEFKPEGHILFIKNNDVPKVVGELGMVLGEANINIASLQLSRIAKGGEALTVIQVDEIVPTEVLDKLKSKEYIVEAQYIKI